MWTRLKKFFKNIIKKMFLFIKKIKTIAIKTFFFFFNIMIFFKEEIYKLIVKAKSLTLEAFSKIKKSIRKVGSFIKSSFQRYITKPYLTATNNVSCFFYSLNTKVDVILNQKSVFFSIIIMLFNIMVLAPFLFKINNTDNSYYSEANNLKKYNQSLFVTNVTTGMKINNFIYKQPTCVTSAELWFKFEKGTECTDLLEKFEFTRDSKLIKSRVSKVKPGLKDTRLSFDIEVESKSNIYASIFPFLFKRSDLFMTNFNLLSNVTRFSTKKNPLLLSKNNPNLNAIIKKSICESDYSKKGKIDHPWISFSLIYKEVSALGLLIWILLSILFFCIFLLKLFSLDRTTEKGSLLIILSSAFLSCLSWIILTQFNSIQILQSALLFLQYLFWSYYSYFKININGITYSTTAKYILSAVVLNIFHYLIVLKIFLLITS